MLCQFSFKNFKSYKEETHFDFQASAISEFKDTLIQSSGGSKLLPVSVIYGPNGGGKTSLLKALSCLISTVVAPVFELGKSQSNLVLQQKADCQPFMFDQTSRNEPTEFNIYFRTANNEFRYFLALLEDHVISECLYRKTIKGKKVATIFERDGDEISLGASIAKSGINTIVNPKMPFLSFLSINYNIPCIAEAESWFESCIIRNYANPMAERSLLLSDDDAFKSSFINALNGMGIDITNYVFDKENNDFILQRVIDENVYSLSFADESEGTKKVFSSLPILMLALSQGRLVIIDELDAKLHPKLLRYIVSLFTNPSINKHGAQLLFTSHDMSTMKNDIFRRDEIWFAALNEGHASDLFSLVEIRKEDGNLVNNTASYDRQYLEGRYGADPYLGMMLDWEAL